MIKLKKQPCLSCYIVQANTCTELECLYIETFLLSLLITLYNDKNTKFLFFLSNLSYHFYFSFCALVNMYVGIYNFKSIYVHMIILAMFYVQHLKDHQLKKKLTQKSIRYILK